jgi:hypothetical protein
MLKNILWTKFRQEIIKEKEEMNTSLLPKAGKD